MDRKGDSDVAVDRSPFVQPAVPLNGEFEQKLREDEQELEAEKEGDSEDDDPKKGGDGDSGSGSDIDIEVGFDQKDDRDRRESDEERTARLASVRAFLAHERKETSETIFSWEGQLIFYLKMNFDGNNPESVKKIKEELDNNKRLISFTPLIIRANPIDVHQVIAGDAVITKNDIWIYGFDIDTEQTTLGRISSDNPILNHILFQDKIQVMTKGDRHYYKVLFNGRSRPERRAATELIKAKFIERKHSLDLYFIMDSNEEIWVLGREPGTTKTEPVLKRIDPNHNDLFTRHFEFLFKDLKNTPSRGYGQNFLVQRVSDTVSILQSEMKRLNIISLEQLLNLHEAKWVLVDPNKIAAVERDIVDYWTGMQTQGIFALSRRNPLVESLLWSYITRSTLVQFSSGYPDFKKNAMPYFVSAGIGGGFLGFGLGMKALQSPNVLWGTDTISTSVRVLWAIRDGMIVFIGVNLIAIAADLALFPEDANVNQLVFWLKIEPAPLAAFLTTSFWRSLSPFTKNKLVSPMVELILESCSEALLHQSMWSTFLHGTCQLDLNKSVIYGSSAAAASMIAKGILSKYHTAYNSSPYTTLLYFYCINALYDVFETFTAQPKQKEKVEEWDLYYWFMVIQSILIAIQTLGSLYFIRQHRGRFIQGFSGELDITSRLMTTEEFHNIIAEKHNDTMQTQRLLGLLKKYSIYLIPRSNLPDEVPISQLRLSEDDGNKIVILDMEDDSDNCKSESEYKACLFVDNKWLTETLQSDPVQKAKEELKIMDVTDLVQKAQKTYDGRMTFPPHIRESGQESGQAKKGVGSDIGPGFGSSLGFGSSPGLGPSPGFGAKAKRVYKEYKSVTNKGKIIDNGNNSFILAELIEAVLKRANLPIPEIEELIPIADVPPRSASGSMEMGDVHAAAGRAADASFVPVVDTDVKRAAEGVVSSPALSGLARPLLPGFGRLQQQQQQQQQRKQQHQQPRPPKRPRKPRPVPPGHQFP